MKITYSIAHAAGMDAGNADKRTRGLKQWDEQSYNTAAATINRLLDIMEKGDK